MTNKLPHPFAWIVSGSIRAAIMSRGAGKTTAGIQWVIEQVAKPETTILIAASTSWQVKTIMDRLASESGAHLNRGGSSVSWENGSYAYFVTPYTLKSRAHLGIAYEGAWFDEFSEYAYKKKALKNIWAWMTLPVKSGNAEIIVTFTPPPGKRMNWFYKMVGIRPN